MRSHTTPPEDNTADKGPGCITQTMQFCMNALMCVNYQTIGQMEEWSLKHRTGTTYQGPVSSEASVLLANTIVLGGVGCAAIGKGMTLEIELQMLVIAVVSFALLEIGIQKVHNYYVYVTQFHKQVEDQWGRIFFMAFSIVRFVVLVLQGNILALWMSTMNNIGSSSQHLFRTIFVMTCLYYFIRWAILLIEVLEQGVIGAMYNNPKDEETVNKMKKTRQNWRFIAEMAHFTVEFVWGVFLFFIVISVLVSMTLLLGWLRTPLGNLSELLHTQ